MAVSTPAPLGGPAERLVDSNGSMGQDVMGLYSVDPRMPPWPLVLWHLCSALVVMRCCWCAVWRSQVLAPGGCALRSSRLDLLPCLCGGGGTIYSRAHRRLVVANKLTAIAAAAVAAATATVNLSPSRWGPGTRGQQASPHAFDPKAKEGQEGTGSPWIGDARDAGGAPPDMVLGPSELSPGGTPSGLEALAVLSVQPTPLPVPLYAPTLTLAVEAAVVTLRGRKQRGGGAHVAADSMEDPLSALDTQQPRVVVGSLLLHGGTRGL